MRFEGLCSWSAFLYVSVPKGGHGQDLSRGFSPFLGISGPFEGPSSNHPLCGWYMILPG